MEGTILIRKRRNRTNFFGTYDEYNNKCKDINWANIETIDQKRVIVRHAEGKMANIGELIKDVLSTHANINIVKYSKHLLRNNETAIDFANKEDALKAMSVINKMASPDFIDPSEIKTDGSVVTANDLKVKVRVFKNSDGNIVAESGGTYVSGTSDAKTQQTSQTSSTNKWIVIGAALVAVTVIVLVILKKKKII